MLGHLVGTAPWAPRALPIPRASTLPRMAFDDPSMSDNEMRDINKVGPNEDRQAQLNQLMNRLRKEGKVAQTSLVEDGERAVRTPPPPPPPPPPELPPPPAPSPPPPLVEAEADASTAAAVDEVPKTTTGVGGTWSGAGVAATGTHKPTTSGSWGVFERPADISKAFGGGRKIGVDGYQEPEEEKERKRKALNDKLKAYRKSMNSDVEAEEEHRAEIEAALKEAAQLSRFGEPRGAVERIQTVRQWLSPPSPALVRPNPLPAPPPGRPGRRLEQDHQEQVQDQDRRQGQRHHQGDARHQGRAPPRQGQGQGRPPS